MPHFISLYELFFYLLGNKLVQLEEASLFVDVRVRSSAGVTRVRPKGSEFIIRCDNYSLF